MRISIAGAGSAPAASMRATTCGRQGAGSVGRYTSTVQAHGATIPTAHALPLPKAAHLGQPQVTRKKELKLRAREQWPLMRLQAQAEERATARRVEL